MGKPRLVELDEAKSQLDDLLRRVTGKGETILITQDGRVQAVFLPPGEYERLLERDREKPDTLTTLEAIFELNARIKARRGGRPLPDPVDVIHEMREERDAELAHLR
ncbi:MAG: type II toxin-antitoxin system Phd/YefM family antitoxin [Calditrichaeota bacterium]|nr:type II toxin-antitoxin system Phd/YefM family antitoxin [Calditrichota bacterium]